MILNSIADLNEAESKLAVLLDDGQGTQAISFADSLTAGRGQDLNVGYLRAVTYANIGEKFQRIELAEKSTQMLRELSNEHTSPEILYTWANTELGIWQLAVQQNGFSTAWLDRRSHLAEARRLFKSIVEDEGAEVNLHLKALTDCGNSYDMVGRYCDALKHYDRALQIDPTFGMALGNRGMTLLRMASLVGEHQSCVLHKAATTLDAAIHNRESVLRNGGQSALDTFERQRGLISGSADPMRNVWSPEIKLGDPHLDWCLQNDLFLHSSPGCIKDSTEILDPISWKTIKVARVNLNVSYVNELIDGWNTIKEDYIVARYLGWLATAADSPIRDQARGVSSRVWFVDTATYGLWDVRTGIGKQAQKASVDVLDKIAVFVHLYFGSGKLRRLYFRGFANDKPNSLVSELAHALRRPGGNRGLTALIDLAGELDKDSDSQLKVSNKLRNAATHRFLNLHLWGTPSSSEASEHAGWRWFIEGLVWQLRFTKSAILYLADMIHIHERRTDSTDSVGGLTVPLVFGRADTDLNEVE